MKKTTKPTKSNDIRRVWHIINVKEKVIGRASTEIAKLLMGKSKSYFVKNLDCGDFVVVINAKQAVLTGKKEEQKVYTRYSGYPGGLRTETAKELRERKPEELIRHAVSGMLPKNKLHDSMMKRLYVFGGEEHPYQDKFER